MLRIITQQAEAQTELRRINERASHRELAATEATVREILDTVKRQGDQALLDSSDGQQALTIQQLRVSGSELDAAYQQVSKELLDALQLACRQLQALHRHRLPKSWVQFAEDETVLGKRYTPIEKVGLYVPNGNRANLSAVLLQAIPAQVAKVPRLVMATPPGAEQKINPGILVAAQEAGVNEIYRVGGAWAIAALAYGTPTIPKVDLIAGWGNIEVMLAKKMVYGSVGIDSLPGASDLIVIADREANPVQIAADLLAQAQREPMAAAILLTPDAAIAKNVQQEVQQQLENHPQWLLTEKALAHYGLIIVVDSLEVAVELSNSFAPQSLQLEVADPWTILEQIRHAGAIFLGNSTPKAVGDYLGGSALNLFPGGAARYASGITVETFMKHSSVIQYSPSALKKLASTLQILAQAEGLSSQADAVRLRTQRVLD
jgi:histidinol dehydrogenase